CLHARADRRRGNRFERTDRASAYFFVAGGGGIRRTIIAAAAPRDSAAKKAGDIQGTEADRGEKAAGETGNDAVRTGDSRPFREKRADDRGRPGPRCADVLAQKRAREVRRLCRLDASTSSSNRARRWSSRSS